MKHLAALLTLNAALFAATFDRYGGDESRQCRQGARPHFYTEKLDGHWYFCTPAGHPFFAQTVYNPAPNGRNNWDNLGTNMSHREVAAAKYGNKPLSWATQTIVRLKYYGFNGVVAYVTDPRVVPTNQPDTAEPIPYVAFFSPSLYALYNDGNKVSEPVKDLIYGIPSTLFGGYRRVTPDVWDDKYKAYVSKVLSADVKNQSARYNDYLIGIMIEDGDRMRGFTAGPDFPAISDGQIIDNGAARSKSGPHLGWITLATSPIQSGRLRESDWRRAPETGFVYSDRTVHSKIALRDFLKARYHNDISALNAAWGTGGFYTTFDSTAVDRTQVVGTGDGATTTYTFTVSPAPVSPYSVLISVDGKVAAGDGVDSDGLTPRFFGPNTVPSRASLNYATGAMTIVFSTPPSRGASIVASWRTNGYGSGGTGLLDEDGSHPWAGCTTNGGGQRLYLKGTPAYVADLDDFLEEHAARWAGDMKDVVNKYFPGRLFLGPSYNGTWGVPARARVLAGVCRHQDALMSAVVPTPNLPASEVQARADFQFKSCGDKPWFPWVGLRAEADSPWFRTQSTSAGTQRERGEQYEQTIRAMLDFTVGDGTRPFAGFHFWQLTDDPSAQNNWGFMDLNDQFYDGAQTLAPGKDHWGYPTGNFAGQFNSRTCAAGAESCTVYIRAFNRPSVTASDFKCSAGDRDLPVSNVISWGASKGVHTATVSGDSLTLSNPSTLHNPGLESLSEGDYVAYVTFDRNGQPTGAPKLCPIVTKIDLTHVTVGNNVYDGAACGIPNGARVIIRESKPVWAAQVFYTGARGPVRCTLLSPPNGRGLYGNYGDLMSLVKEANSFWLAPSGRQADDAPARRH